MALKVIRNDELWFELSGKRFHRNDLAMVANFISQLIYNDDDEYGLSTEEIDANVEEFLELFGKFQINHTRFLDKLNNFLQPYHLEIVIDNTSATEGGD